MTRSFLAVFAGCAVALAACQDQREQSPSSSIAVRDSAGIRIVQNVVPEPVPACPVSGPEVTIGELDGPPEYQLYNVFGARRLRDGRIVLMNRGSNELRFYDSAGVYLSPAGRQGQGRGEFRRGDGIWVTAGDTLWVGDLVPPWRYLLFGPSEEWVRTVQLQPLQPVDPVLVTVLENGSSVSAHYFINAPSAEFTQQYASAVLYGRDGDFVDTLGVYPMGRYARAGQARTMVTVGPYFEPVTSMDGAGRRIYLGHGSEAEVTVFQLVAGGVQLAELIRWTPGDRTVREADIAAIRQSMREGFPNTLPAEMLEAMMNAERPATELFPVFNSIVANRGGGFWVRRYARPGDIDVSRWLAFDVDGRFTCEVTLPQVQVVDLGSGYLLAQQRSDLGVERVVLYRFDTP